MLKKDVNSMAEKKVYNYLGRKSHQIVENIKSRLEFSTPTFKAS